MLHCLRLKMEMFIFVDSFCYIAISSNKRPLIVFEMCGNIKFKNIYVRL